MDQSSIVKIEDMIRSLDSLIEDPSKGLPEHLFLFVSRITPMINVDLLIKNEMNQTLLTWREDGYWPPGWHIPGGIIRFQEKASDRIRAVAAYELGTGVRFKKNPLAINEIIIPSRRVRGHFISLLYECSLTGPPSRNVEPRGGAPVPGEWAWHEKCPEDLIPVHDIYRKYL